jgi:predicted esterase
VSADRRGAPHAHHIRVQRTARYYTIGGGSLAPRAVWIVLHGYGQLAATFVQYFADLADDDSLIVAPEALNRCYLVTPESAPAKDRPVGATWMTREDRASEISDYVEYLDAVYEDVAASPARDGATVNVVGFSQGAATATRWVTHGRSHINRLVVWGGLLPPDTDLSRGPASLKGARLTFVLGKQDHYVDDAMLSTEQNRLDAAGVQYDTILFDGGHVVRRSVFEQLRAGAG